MEKENRLDYLDSLRGIASMIVVFSHYILAYGIDMKIKPITFSPLHLFFDGFAAVSFFFVLSGFVLTLSLIKTFDLKSFYFKRIFRIMPSYLIVLFISGLLYFSFYPIKTIPESSKWINEFWTKPLDYFAFLKQVFFLETGNNAHLVFQNWTLNVEMKFSLLIPFLYLILINTNIYIFLLFNFVLVSFFCVPVFCFHFSLGIILAVYKNSTVNFFLKWENKYRIYLLLILIFFLTYRYTVPMYYYYYFRKFNFLNNEDLIWIITGFGSCVLLVYCLSFEFLKRSLNNSILKFIGRISYSIYLVHSIVLIYIVPYFIHFLNSINMQNIYAIHLVTLFVLFGACIIFSYLLNRIIEKPFVSLGNELLISLKHISSSII
jgi:peptidoglycan/LPS O-acetylase OafA/YrhL